jgi:hypothetical protein
MRDIESLAEPAQAVRLVARPRPRRPVSSGRAPAGCPYCLAAGALGRPHGTSVFAPGEESSDGSTPRRWYGLGRGRPHGRRTK